LNTGDKSGNNHLFDHSEDDSIEGQVKEFNIFREQLIPALNEDS
jgi:hypothetical protein